LRQTAPVEFLNFSFSSNPLQWSFETFYVVKKLFSPGANNSDNGAIGAAFN
jgi:hypothetical protein